MAAAAPLTPGAVPGVIAWLGAENSMAAANSAATAASEVNFRMTTSFSRSGYRDGSRRADLSPQFQAGRWPSRSSDVHFRSGPVGFGGRWGGPAAAAA